MVGYKIMDNRIKRIEWIDTARGIGIISVIVAHIGLEPMASWLYSFHMPLFFFLSGYVFSKKKDFKTFIRGKIYTIMIPYVCLGLPLVLITLYRKYQIGSLTLYSAIRSFASFVIQRRVYSLWFLTCLLLLNILFYVVIDKIEDNKKIVFLSVGMVIGGLLYYKFEGCALPWNVDVVPMAFPFFFAGYLYKIKPNIDQFIIKSKKNIIVLVGGALIINLVCAVCSYNISDFRFDMCFCKYGEPILSYTAAFAGIVFVIGISKLVNLGCIRYIGENSLLYFAWHQTMMIPFTARILKMMNFFPNGQFYTNIFKWIQVILTIAILTVLNQLIMNTRFRFILGK